MQLVLNRSQREGIFGGKPVFTLQARAALTAEELAGVKKHKLGHALLYQRDPRGIAPGWGGIAAHFVHSALDLTITVNNLVEGTVIECKDVMQMLAAQEQLKEAAQVFSAVLKAATQFGGDEVLEL
jgi:hypothetical protein